MSRISLVDFIEQLLPPAPSDEIPRDDLIRQIIGDFKPDCQRQMVVGGPQTGKTNLLAQFVREFPNRCVCYFITPSPLTQRQHTFLYTMCYQLDLILEKNPPPDQIGIEDLKSLFSTLSLNLARQAKMRKETYYFVVDGLEHGLKGTEGERIIDLFPLQTSPHGPYLLFSCRSDQLDKLPEDVRCCAVPPGEFNRLDTERYLGGLGFSQEEIYKIHKKYQGVPGYLKIVKETKRANPKFDVDSAPLEIDRLIRQQVELIMKAASQSTIQALEILAACPASLPAKILAGLMQTDESSLVESLEHTALVKFDLRDCRLEYSNGLVQESVRKGVGVKIKEIVKDLLNYVREKHSNEDFLLTLLLNEAKDYEGLCSMISQGAVIAALNATGDISNVMKTLRIVSEMARQGGKTDDLVRWTLGMTAARSFVSHAVSSNEIRALLAIGESQEALSKAYSMPEISSKIRLLAMAYASMKERGDRVPKSALDELAAMVERLNLEDLDKEMAQEVAVDLFPVLPDVAFSLLEKAIGQSEKRSIIEVAIETIESSLQDSQGVGPSSGSKGRVDLGYVSQLLSSWLNGLPLSELIEGLRPVENTNAREYIIRQWCRQNARSEEIVKAIDLWLDTVVGDREFVLLLRSLRHISEVVVKVPLPERKRLIDRLRVPGFTALDSPKEEWVRFHLNLAEALFEVDQESARVETRDVHRIILDSPLELDVKAFCLARLWATINKISTDDSRWISDVEIKFNEAFSSLLRDSAEQLDTLVETIQALVDVDPMSALIATLELNTYPRRVGAIRKVLGATLRKRGEQDFADLIENALQQLEEIERGVILVEITSDLNAREITLASPNLDMLLKFSREIGDPALKAQALSNLASLFRKISFDNALRITEEAIDSWRKEDDLKARLSLGFEMVESMAKLDINRAKQLYAEVRELKFQPGSTLALGNLGSTFKETLDLAIRAVTIKDLSESEEALRSLENFISRIPSQVVRVQLFAKLAASAYRVGYSEFANDVVRTKVIAGIGQLQSNFDRDNVIGFSLPVIAEYDNDLSTARTLSDRLPYLARDRAWHSVVLWSLCRSFLGDHRFDPEDLRVKNGHGSKYDRVRFTLSGPAQEV